MKSRNVASAAAKTQDPFRRPIAPKDAEAQASRPPDAGPSNTADAGVAYQYAAVQQMTEHRDYIEYQLTVREQPKHSRMCGVGEKADRRPIDPAPIVQLRVITHDRPVRDTSIQSSTSAPIAPPIERIAGHGPAVPSTPGVRRGMPVTTDHGDGWEDKAWYLENPYYFMYAMLCSFESDEELHLLQDGKTRYTSGSCVSCLYHLKDVDGSHQGFFVFPDLSIRVEGVYRLKLCLFETIGHTVHHCKSIYSAPFNVYTAKQFPGMEESTPLSKSFADQGLKVRVRKQPRMRRRSSKRKDDNRSDGSDADNPPTSLPPDWRSPKRSRGSEEPIPPIPALPSSSGLMSKSRARGADLTRVASRGHIPQGLPPTPTPQLHIATSPAFVPSQAHPTWRPPGPMYEKQFDATRVASGPLPASGRPSAGRAPDSGMPLSRSIPDRGQYPDDESARHGFADRDQKLRARMPPPLHRSDGAPPASWTRPPSGQDDAYLHGARWSERALLPPPPAGMRGSLHYDEYPHYREGLPPAPGFHRNVSNAPRAGPAPEALPPPPYWTESARRGPPAFARSPERDLYPSYRDAREPLRHAGDHDAAMDARERHRQQLEEEAMLARRSYVDSGLPRDAAVGRAYVQEPPRFAQSQHEARRQPYIDERFDEPSRGDRGGPATFSSAIPPLREPRLPTRQLTPLDPASSDPMHSRPTLPPLPALRVSSRNTSPVGRLPRADSFYDGRPRFPSQLEADASARSFSAGPPVQRTTSPLMARGPEQYRLMALSRSPQLVGRQPARHAPAPARMLPPLPPHDLERAHGRMGTEPLPPPRHPQHWDLDSPQWRGPRDDGREEWDGRPLGVERERQRDMGQDGRRGRARERERDEERDYHPYQ